jgi:predicted metallopeptidase
LEKQKINITDVLTDLIKEIIIRSHFFSHIDTTKLIVCLSSNKKNGRGSIYGKLVPFKFKNGSDTVTFKGKYYSIPRITNNGTDILYAIYFHLPRFFDLPADKKLNVIFHELYHISPDFNGDIRRMGNVKKAHGSSKKRFDLKFENEVKSFYEYISKTYFLDFLRMDSKSLKNKYHIYARRMKIPKPIVINNPNYKIKQSSF